MCMRWQIKVLVIVMVFMLSQLGRVANLATIKIRLKIIRGGYKFRVQDLLIER